MTAREAPDAHVIFELDVDDEGWPPVGSERLWAYSLGDDRYRTDNVPWFVRDLAAGDILRATPRGDGEHPVFDRLEERSSNLTIRLIVFRAGPLHGQLQLAVDAFTPLGVYAEGVARFGMVALDIPSGVPLEPIYRRLLAGRADGSWEWEEGRIDDRWAALGE